MWKTSGSNCGFYDLPNIWNISFPACQTSSFSFLSLLPLLISFSHLKYFLCNLLIFIFWLSSFLSWPHGSRQLKHMTRKCQVYVAYTTSLGRLCIPNKCVKLDNKYQRVSNMWNDTLHGFQCLFLWRSKVCLSYELRPVSRRAILLILQQATCPSCWSAKTAPAATCKKGCDLISLVQRGKPTRHRVLQPVPWAIPEANPSTGALSHSSCLLNQPSSYKSLSKREYKTTSCIQDGDTSLCGNWVRCIL